MRENRLYGSEGGERNALPDPYQLFFEKANRMGPRLRGNDGSRSACAGNDG
jgi:hypothetical protein